MDFKIIAVTEETENYKKAKNKFITVNCDDTMLYWYSDESVSNLGNWYNSEDFDGPCNDDLVLYLEIEEGHKLFDYKDQYLKEHLDCIPRFDIIPAIWNICSVMQSVGYNDRINEEEQAKYEHERNTRFELDEPELMFTQEGNNRTYYDMENFLTEFADGNYFTSDVVSDVELYGKAQNVRLNITSLFELARLLDAEDRFKFRGTADSYSCVPDGTNENSEDVKTNNFYSINSNDVISVLAATLPDKKEDFNSETGYNEPQHWLDMPNGRSLEIVFEDTGDDNRYYSWRLHCNEDEFDNDTFRGTNGIIWESTSEDYNYDTKVSMLIMAIKVAKHEPVVIKPRFQFTRGEEIWLRVNDNETYHSGFVIDYSEDQFLRVIYPDLREIIKYEPKDFEKVYLAKAGRSNDLINALF